MKLLICFFLLSFAFVEKDCNCFEKMELKSTVKKYDKSIRGEVISIEKILNPDSNLLAIGDSFYKAKIVEFSRVDLQNTPDTMSVYGPIGNQNCNHFFQLNENYELFVYTYSSFKNAVSGIANIKNTYFIALSDSQKYFAVEIPTESTEKFVVGVTENAEYIDGEDALSGFLMDNLVWPGEDVKCTVLVQFQVDTFGNVVKPVVKKACTKLVDAECVRVVKLLKFKPGKQNGVKVKSVLQLPFYFETEE